MPEIEYSCPVCEEDSTTQEENRESTITVQVGYEPPDPSYGADADGRRGTYIPGYFYAENIVPCVYKHELSTEVRQQYFKLAIEDAEHNARSNNENL